MNNIEVSAAEKTNSTYHVHLLNQQLMEGIGRGDANDGFEDCLKKYGNSLYNLLFSVAAGSEFNKLRKGSFCLRLHLPPRLESLLALPDPALVHCAWLCNVRAHDKKV